jgi:thioester reductase-like protein
MPASMHANARTEASGGRWGLSDMVTMMLMACMYVALFPQIAQLKEWVTDNRLEDDDYFKMMQASKTKKSDWVEFVKQKLESAP